MIYKRIVESVLNSSSELIEVILIEMINKCRNNLLIEHFVHKACHSVILHAVTNDIKSCKICAKYKSCVSAVEDTNLAVLVWHYIRNNVHINTGLLERKSVFKDIRSFDDPYTKDLTNIDELIVKMRANYAHKCGTMLKAIETYGLTDIHRKSFCRSFLQETLF